MRSFWTVCAAPLLPPLRRCANSLTSYLLVQHANDAEKIGMPLRKDDTHKSRVYLQLYISIYIYIYIDIYMLLSILAGWLTLCLADCLASW